MTGKSNHPHMVDPATAAQDWPHVQALAERGNLKLVSPVRRVLQPPALVDTATAAAGIAAGAAADAAADAVGCGSV